MNNQSQPTIKTVATEAGVSIATVSRVLNGNKSVAPNLYDEVWKAVDKLGYKPNIAARSMKGQRSGTIGFLVPNITMPFFNYVIAGAITEAQKYNYNILVSSSSSCLEEQKKALANFNGSVIDGMIFCPISQTSDYPSLEDFMNIPIVIAYRKNIYANLPHIYINNEKGGYISTKYLINLERKRIAFFAGLYDEKMTKEDLIRLARSNTIGFYSSVDRLKGYFKAHEEAEIEIDPNLIISSGSGYSDGYNAAQKLLYSSIGVDAIIAFNDSVASGAINFLDEQGIFVPEEISVIGYDNGPVANIVRPTLTSVNQDADKLGAGAVEMMIDLLDGKKVNDRQLDVFLSVKKSTTIKRG